MIKQKLIRNYKTIFCIIICTVSAVILIRFPKDCAEGVKRGLELCAQTMIPSLFPFLVLSSFILSSGVLDFTGEKTDSFFRKVFRLSGRSGCTVLFSLFAGFPVGCSMASDLYLQNKISCNEAKRIAFSSVNAGPAFVIGAVGTMMLSSFKAGVLLFTSLSLSSLIIAFISRFIFTEKPKAVKPSPHCLSISQSLVTSVYNASKSMFSICAWILLFSCFLNVISMQDRGETFSVASSAFLEVTSGCLKASQAKNPVILSAILGWSGLCVHCQVFPYIMKIGLKAKYYFCARILNSMLSPLICYSLFKIFPCEISVFSSGMETLTKTFAVSAPAAIGLMLMCAIFILDLDTGEKV